MHLILQAYGPSQLSPAHSKHAQNAHTSPQRAIILRLMLGAIAFLLFSLDGCFVNMRGCENTTHNIQKKLATQDAAEPRPCRLADGELRPAARACHCPRHERVLEHTARAQEKVGSQDLSTISSERI